MSDPDVAVVGSGVNGLAAAVVCARAGLSVLVAEGAETIGGAARTAGTTLPGFLHDLGSAVHPMAVASPFFRRFGLADRVEMLTPEISYAHPMAGQPAVLAHRELRRAAAGLGEDGPAWQRLLGPLVERAGAVARLTGDTVLRVPTEPEALVRFGLAALDQAGPWWNRRWRTPQAAALLTGVLAHAVRPLPSLPPAAAGLALAVAAHAGGWPIPHGGSRSIVDALAADLTEHGGRIETGRPVRALGEVPARVHVLDTGVPALRRLAGDRIHPLVSAWLATIRAGDGIGKVDYALGGPVPWSDPRLREVVTLHLGGSRASIAAAEREVARGRVPDRPYVLVAQPSVLDPSRAPAGKHVLWAYTHLPAGSALDPTELVSSAIERDAPGFRDQVLAANAASAADVGRWDPNLIGGDIAAGALTMRQLVARPLPSSDPWHVGRRVYLCSAAAAPGPGVHGQGGYRAARSLLRREFGIAAPPALR